MEYLIKVMDLYIKIKCQYSLLYSRIAKYIVNNQIDKYDFEITYSDEVLNKTLKQNPHLSIEEVEYMGTSIIFYRKILDYDAMLIHSSAVCVDNKAYCFSADSGIGKSTHTKLYLKNFPNSYIINDDKPAYRLINNQVFVYGTPWSGKDDLSENIKVPLQALCFLKRAKNNSIKKLDNKEAIKNIMNQTLRIHKESFLDKLLVLIDKIVSFYPIYELSCNMEDEACKVSYQTMKGESL